MIGARTYFKQAEEVRTRLGDLAYEAATKKDPELIKAVAEEISETFFSAQDALGQFIAAVESPALEMEARYLAGDLSGLHTALEAVSDGDVT